MTFSAFQLFGQFTRSDSEANPFRWSNKAGVAEFYPKSLLLSTHEHSIIGDSGIV